MDTQKIIQAYSHGDCSAAEAADRLGPGFTIADVYVLARNAGLPLPDADGAFERQQFERAKRLFGRSDERTAAEQC